MRRTVNMPDGVKRRIEDLKKHLKYKTDAQVIAYLAVQYDDAYQRITMPKHEDYLRKAEELYNQNSL